MNISLVPKDQCYFLSGRKAHFYRFCDTTFRDKWTGFWIMDKKFFDYFAFQIDDEWLSKDNIKNFEFHESEAKSIYETHLGKITEIVSMTDGEEIKYAPLICGETDYEVSEELRLLVGKDWYWECEYKGTFRLCRA